MNNDPISPLGNSYSDMMKILSNTSYDDPSTDNGPFPVVK